MLTFYNCCFTHKVDGTDEAKGTLYLNLEGKGKASFDSACFDTTRKDRAMSIKGIEATFDHEDIMFGNCVCDVFLPTFTGETLITVTSSGDDSANTVDPGLITGIFFGLLILIIILALLILFLLWRCRRHHKSSTEECPPPEEPEETITSINEGLEEGIDGATNDNPLFAVELSTNDVFNNEFEEKSFFLKDN